MLQPLTCSFTGEVVSSAAQVPAKAANRLTPAVSEVILPKESRRGEFKRRGTVEIGYGLGHI